MIHASSRTRRFGPLLYGRPARVFVHGSKGAGIQCAQLGLDPFEQIGLMRHGLATHHEGPLGFVASNFVGEAELLKFISHQEIGVLKAQNPGELVHYIKWASIAASVGSSQGKSKAGGSPQNDAFVVLPSPPPQPTPTTNTNLF